MIHHLKIGDVITSHKHKGLIKVMCSFGKGGVVGKKYRKKGGLEEREVIVPLEAVKAVQLTLF